MTRIAWGWCNRWCNGIGEGEGREGVERPAGVGHAEGGVHVRRQPRVGVPHQFLNDPRVGTAFRQQRSERAPEGVGVHHEPAVVGVRDASRFQVGFQGTSEVDRHGEQRGVARKGLRDRIAVIAGFDLGEFQLLSYPLPQVVGHVRPERQERPLAVLLIRRPQLDVWRIGQP